MTSNHFIKPGMAEAFALLEEIISTHSASAHPLFTWLTEGAEKTGLTPKQFEIFRSGMFSRINDTTVNISRLQKWALKKGHYDIAHTAVHNIFEESGGLVLEKNRIDFNHTHKEMSEGAFNSLGRIFDLKPSTMIAEKKNMLFPEQFAQVAIFKYCYKKNAPLASWIQERASGGNGKSQKGMMGDLFGIFSAYQHSIPSHSFKSIILPYFQAHVKIAKDGQGNYNFQFKENSVEFQHGQRARGDATVKFDSPEQVKQASVFVESMLNAQSALFDRMLEEIEKAKNIGEPIKPKEPQKIINHREDEGKTR